LRTEPLWAANQHHLSVGGAPSHRLVKPTLFCRRFVSCAPILSSNHNLFASAERDKPLPNYPHTLQRNPPRHANSALVARFSTFDETCRNYYRSIMSLSKDATKARQRRRVRSQPQQGLGAHPFVVVLGVEFTPSLSAFYNLLHQKAARAKGF